MLCATEDRLNFAHFLQAVKHSLLFVLYSRLLAEHYFLHPAHPCKAHCGPHRGRLLCLLEEVEYKPTHGTDYAHVAFEAPGEHANSARKGQD